jgi:hypothetical protein
LFQNSCYEKRTENKHNIPLEKLDDKEKCKPQFKFKGKNNLQPAESGPGAYES